MKTDRILEIIIYLINHDRVPASRLAKRFHVSVRTIQRDIVSISSIGIPVYSEGGKYGGYFVLPTYKIKNSGINSGEQQMIIKALESLATSYTNDTLKALIEKYNAIIGTLTEKNHVPVWSLLPYIINGTRGICSHIPRKKSSTGHIKSQECKTCK